MRTCGFFIQSPLSFRVLLIAPQGDSFFFIHASTARAGWFFRRWLIIHQGIIHPARRLWKNRQGMLPVGYGGRKEACMHPISPVAGTVQSGAA